MPLKLVTAAVGTITALLVVLFVLLAPQPIEDLPTAELPSPTDGPQLVAALVSFNDGAPALPLPTAAPALPLPTSAPLISTSARLNGVPLDRIVVMPDAVRQNIRQIFARGQALGRNPRAFAKVGDSTMAYPPFLAAFGSPNYRLGSYTYLQRTIDRYSGSFAHESVAVRKGMHTWSEFDPAWANPSICQPDEGPLACELRLVNPSVAIIRLGANDFYTPRLFNEQLNKIVNLCLSKGIVPVLGTKPDRLEGPDNTLNKLVMQAASTSKIPLWDYDLIVTTVPGKGLVKDKVHFQGGGTHDYTLAKALSSGDSLEDLTALMMLDAIAQEVAGATAR